MAMNPFHLTPLLHPGLTAPVTSFARQHSYKYAFSQQLPSGTRQTVLHNREEK